MNSLHKYPLDDLFRDKLGEYGLEPPDAVWNNISSALGHKKKKPFAAWFFARSLRWYFILFLLLIPALWLTNNFILNNRGYKNVSVFSLPEPESRLNSSGIADANKTTNISETENIAVNNSNDNYGQASTNKNNKIPVTPKSIEAANNNKPPVKRVNEVLIESDDAGKGQSTVIIDKKNDAEVHNDTELNVDIININNEQKDKVEVEFNVNPANNEIAFKDFKSEAAKTDFDKAAYYPPPDDYGQRNPWTFGAHFTPEIIVNPFYSDVFTNNFNKYAYAFDVTTIYNFKGFYLETGVGLLYSKDRLNFKVEYEKYVETGSYQDVQFISFDTVGNVLVPVYHTTTITLYDTLKSTTIAQMPHNYSYLQIPFYFGYSRSIDRVNYTIKGGVAYNYLLNKKEPELVYFDSEAYVLGIDRKTPYRARSNWNILFSVGFGYKISNLVSLSLEPTVRIYTHSLYDRNMPGTKRSPYAIGLKYGLIFNL